MPEVDSTVGVIQNSAGAAVQPDLGRQEERFDISGEAEVIVNGGTSLFRGRILNISSSGCYVQTLVPTRLLRGTTVDLVLVYKRKLLRVTAEARFSKPRVGMGFRFIRMTDDTNALLHDLIEEMQGDPEDKEEVAPRTAWQDAVKH